MKLLLSLFFVISLSHSAYLYKQKNRCVESYYFDQSTQILYYNYSHNPDRFYSTTSTSQEFIPGFEYNSTSGICSIPSNAQYLGLDSTDYYLLIALVAVLSGFVFLFFSIYIAVEVAKK